MTVGSNTPSKSDLNSFGEAGPEEHVSSAAATDGRTRRTLCGSAGRPKDATDPVHHAQAPVVGDGPTLPDEDVLDARLAGLALDGLDGRLLGEPLADEDRVVGLPFEAARCPHSLWYGQECCSISKTTDHNLRPEVADLSTVRPHRARRLLLGSRAVSWMRRMRRTDRYLHERVSSAFLAAPASWRDGSKQHTTFHVDEPVLEVFKGGPFRQSDLERSLPLHIQDVGLDLLDVLRGRNPVVHAAMQASCDAHGWAR
jgi:hypothetical protein